MYTCSHTHIHRVLSNKEKVYIYIYLYICKYGYLLIYHSKSGYVFTKEVYTVYIILIFDDMLFHNVRSQTLRLSSSRVYIPWLLRL